MPASLVLNDKDVSSNPIRDEPCNGKTLKNTIAGYSHKTLRKTRPID